MEPAKTHLRLSGNVEKSDKKQETQFGLRLQVLIRLSFRDWNIPFYFCILQWPIFMNNVWIQQQNSTQQCFPRRGKHCCVDILLLNCTLDQRSWPEGCRSIFIIATRCAHYCNKLLWPQIFVATIFSIVATKFFFTKLNFQDCCDNVIVATNFFFNFSLLG